MTTTVICISFRGPLGESWGRGDWFAGAASPLFFSCFCGSKRFYHERASPLGKMLVTSSEHISGVDFAPVFVTAISHARTPHIAANSALYILRGRNKNLASLEGRARARKKRPHHTRSQQQAHSAIFFMTD